MIRSIKKFSNFIGNRIRDLRVCSIVPQANTLAHAPPVSVVPWLIIMGSGFEDLVYLHFFTIIVNYNSSHIEILLNSLTNESLMNLLTSLSLPRCPNISHHVEQLIVLCCPVLLSRECLYQYSLPRKRDYRSVAQQRPIPSQYWTILHDGECLSLPAVCKYNSIVWKGKRKR
jgi:hypothetical protein